MLMNMHLQHHCQPVAENANNLSQQNVKTPLPQTNHQTMMINQLVQLQHQNLSQTTNQKLQTRFPHFSNQGGFNQAQLSGKHGLNLAGVVATPTQREPQILPVNSAAIYEASQNGRQIQQNNFMNPNSQTFRPQPPLTAVDTTKSQKAFVINSRAACPSAYPNPDLQSHESESTGGQQTMQTDGQNAPNFYPSFRSEFLTPQQRIQAVINESKIQQTSSPYSSSNTPNHVKQNFVENGPGNVQGISQTSIINGSQSQQTNLSLNSGSPEFEFKPTNQQTQRIVWNSSQQQPLMVQGQISTTSKNLNVSNFESQSAGNNGLWLQESTNSALNSQGIMKTPQNHQSLLVGPTSVQIITPQKQSRNMRRRKKKNAMRGDGENANANLTCVTGGTSNCVKIGVIDENQALSVNNFSSSSQHTSSSNSSSSIIGEEKMQHYGQQAHFSSYSDQKVNIAPNTLPFVQNSHTQQKFAYDEYENQTNQANFGVFQNSTLQQQAFSQSNPSNLDTSSVEFSQSSANKWVNEVDFGYFNSENKNVFNGGDFMATNKNGSTSINSHLQTPFKQNQPPTQINQQFIPMNGQFTNNVKNKNGNSSTIPSQYHQSTQQILYKVKRKSERTETAKLGKSESKVVSNGHVNHQMTPLGDCVKNGVKSSSSSSGGGALLLESDTKKALEDQTSVVTQGTNNSSATTTPATSNPVRRLKYEMCKNWREKGSCKYGNKCLFAHGENELTKRTSAVTNPVLSSPPKTSKIASSAPESTSTTQKMEENSVNNEKVKNLMDKVLTEKKTSGFVTPEKSSSCKDRSNSDDHQQVNAKNTVNDSKNDLKNSSNESTTKKALSGVATSSRRVSNCLEKNQRQDGKFEAKLVNQETSEAEISQQLLLMKGDLNHLLDDEIVQRSKNQPELNTSLARFKSTEESKEFANEKKRGPSGQKSTNFAKNSQNHSQASKSPLGGVNTAADSTQARGCGAITNSSLSTNNQLQYGSTISQGNVSLLLGEEEEDQKSASEQDQKQMRRCSFDDDCDLLTFADINCLAQRQQKQYANQRMMMTHSSCQQNKVGEGLIPATTTETLCSNNGGNDNPEEEEDIEDSSQSEEQLSSEEENLIAISASEIKNLLLTNGAVTSSVSKEANSSKFLSSLPLKSCNSEMSPQAALCQSQDLSEEHFSGQVQNSKRRLRVFEDITHQNEAGEDQEFPPISSQQI